VLVVDVDDDVRSVICEVLADAGYRATCVAGLAAARERLASANVPKLVLMCWDMQSSPRDKVALLDAMPVGTSVVLMSTHPTVERIARSLGVPFVIKPFTVEELLAVVERASEPPPEG
jgi:DNA-binding NtrC family response regulator